MLVGRRSPLHPRQAVDTRVHAVYPHLLPRRHFAATIPVRRVEELGCEGGHHISSDSPGSSARTLPRRIGGPPMDLTHRNGCCRQCACRRCPPLLPRHPHPPHILRRRLCVSDTYFLDPTEIPEVWNVAPDNVRC